MYFIYLDVNYSHLKAIRLMLSDSGEHIDSSKCRLSGRSKGYLKPGRLAANPTPQNRA